MRTRAETGAAVDQSECEIEYENKTLCSPVWTGQVLCLCGKINMLQRMSAELKEENEN